MTAALVVTDLHKSYRRGPETVHALQGVSLRADPGRLTVLTGRSGSGKTTLLNCVAGWERPDAGSVHIPEVPQPHTPWQQLAVVPQRFGLLSELTLAENVALPVRLAGLPDPSSAAREMLAALEIAHLADRPPAEVSLGEQQRTNLARALVLRPAVLVADEPTGRLDEELSARMLDLLHRFCAEHGTAALLASHDAVARERADVLLRLQDGRLVEP